MKSSYFIAEAIFSTKISKYSLVVWLNVYPPNQNSMPIARDAFTLGKPRGQLVSPWCLLVQHREARRTTKLDVLLLTFRNDTIYDLHYIIHQLTNLAPHLNPICQIGFPGPMFTRRDHTQFFFRCGEVRPGTLKGQQRHIFLSGHCISIWGGFSRQGAHTRFSGFFEA